MSLLVDRRESARANSASDAGRRRGPTARRTIGALVLIGALAGALIFVATRNGAPAGPDNAVYVGVARNVASGHGLNAPFHMYPLGNVSIGTPPPGHASPSATPMVTYAPLEPVLMAIGGNHALGAAEIEAALFFALTVVLAGVTVLSVTGEWWAAVAAQLVLSFSLADRLSSPGTEAFATLLTVAAFALLLRHLRRPRASLLVAGSIVIGFATLQRFAAGGLIVWAVIVLLAHRRRRDALGLLAMSSAPLAAWFAYEEISGRTSGHQFAVHFVTNTMRAGVRSVSMWVLPADAPLALAIAAALAVGVFAAYVAVNSRQTAARVLLLYAVVQVVMVEIAATFFDAGVNLEPREFIPVFVAVVMGVACAAPRLPLAKPLTAAASALFVLGGVVVLAHPERGYATAKWRTSPLMADVRAMPADTIVYTNAPDAVYLLANRAVSTVPETRSYSTLKPNPRFAAQIAEIRQTLSRRGGYVVYVRGLSRDDFVPTEATLRRLLNLRLVRDEPDGAVYALGTA